MQDVVDIMKITAHIGLYSVGGVMFLRALRWALCPTNELGEPNTFTSVVFNREYGAVLVWMSALHFVVATIITIDVLSLGGSASVVLSNCCGIGVPTHISPIHYFTLLANTLMVIAATSRAKMPFSEYKEERDATSVLVRNISKGSDKPNPYPPIRQRGIPPSPPPPPPGWYP